jgi:hypothetical protein
VERLFYESLISPKTWWIAGSVQFSKRDIRLFAQQIPHLAAVVLLYSRPAWPGLQRDPGVSEQSGCVRRWFIMDHKSFR